MKTGWIQFDVSHDRSRNLEQIRQKLPGLACDLVVLPELCTCGYLQENRKTLRRLAEPVPGGPSVQAMQTLSRDCGCTIVFGMAEKEGPRLYNTAVVVSRGDYVGKYRKIHLSDYERNLFDGGTENPVFRVDGLCFGVQICFDSWFPEISRGQVRQGAELLCVLGNFGGETTCQIVQVRAIENVTPVVMCNRVGTEEQPDLRADFLGRSLVCSGYGTVLLQGPAAEEAAAGCELRLTGKRANVICSDFDREIGLHYPKI